MSNNSNSESTEVQIESLLPARKIAEIRSSVDERLTKIEAALEQIKEALGVLSNNQVQIFGLQNDTFDMLSNATEDPDADAPWKASL